MLAISPLLYLTPYGWPLEDQITKVCNEPNILNESLLDFPSFDQIQQEFAPETSSSFGGAVNGGMGDGLRVVKKLKHNESERDRRKRVNNLYESLRAVLPTSSDRKLWSNSSSNSTTRQEDLCIKKQSGKDAIINEESSIVTSMSVLNEKEAVVQLISSGNNKDISFLSKVLEKLEEEENGLILLNATTFKCFGEGMFLSTLHFQVQGNHKIEAEKMKEKLRSFLQQ